MAVPPGNPAVPRDWFRGVLKQYVAGSDTQGRPEGRPYYSRSLRSAQSRKRVPSFTVAVTPGRDEISGLRSKLTAKDGLVFLSSFDRGLSNEDCGRK